jgi:hypothetical protein
MTATGSRDRPFPTQPAQQEASANVQHGKPSGGGKKAWTNYRAGLDHLSNAENDFKRLAGRVFNAGCDFRDEWMHKICVNL